MTNQIKLFTPVQIPSHKEKITCDSKILTIGSCFSDHIGICLSNHLFDAMVNPFGTVFNPVSIAKILNMAIDNDEIEGKDLDSIGNRHFHYDFHSSFDNSSSVNVEKDINEAIKRVETYIQNIDFLILTFGTSIVYKLNSDNRIVSNCHKVPNHNFHKEFLTVDLIEESIDKTLDRIIKLNPSVKIIFTVSPVRHTKEGLVENSLSKSRLIELCHRLSKKNANASYFPSYEIMIDELRDYRYYNSDLIHPSEQAIDIIWSRFMDTYLDKKAIQKVQDIKALNAAKNHIPFDPLANEHQKFKQAQLGKIEKLKISYPEIDFQQFEAYFK